MIGDFAPMKVGNKWVYSDFESKLGQFWSANRTIKITSMTQKGDSTFYTVLDSTYINQPGYKTYLELNNSNFLYDPSTKTFGKPEDFFKFHQLPDSILKKGVFLNQNLFSYSIEDSSCSQDCITSADVEKWQWIQNYGLFYWSHWYFGGYSDYGSSELKLISFNDQPVDTSMSATAHKKTASALFGNQLAYSDTRSQIHWRGLSGEDHLGVQLFDFRGKVLFSSSNLSGIYVLNTSQFPSGAYILRYRVNNGIWKQFSFARNYS